jgi:hypothetical protein
MDAQGARWLQAVGSPHGALCGAWIEVDDTMWHTQMSRMLPTSGGICGVLIRTVHVQLRRMTRTNVVHRVLSTPTLTSWSVIDWRVTSFIFFVHSKYYYFPFLANELIQLPVVDADRTPPYGCGDFVPADGGVRIPKVDQRASWTNV